jgi:hypothetical protein
MQSYAGVLRLFPNTRNLGRTRFRDLRAVGAMLVSASWDGRQASGVSILSEKGALCRMVNPWPGAGARVVLARDGKEMEVKREGTRLKFATQAGERYKVEKVSKS